MSGALGRLVQERLVAEANPGAAGRGTIVVRGDLYSDSGYGRATRALSRLLAGCGRHFFGVSLHEHASRRTNAFPFTVISGDALANDPRFVGSCIVNVCLPSSFIAVPDARNIGYFFWETDQFPPQEFWKAKMRLMDELWAPSTWQAALLERETGRSNIAVVPWPQGVEPVRRAPREDVLSIKAHPPQRLEQLANYLLRLSSDPKRRAEQVYEQAEHEAGRSSRFDPLASPTLREVIDSEGDTFLAVQTDAPRKGLHLLLAAWLQFRQTHEGAKAKLIIKMSSIDVTIDIYRLHFHMSLAVRRPMRRLSLADAGVHFVYDRLSDDAMTALAASSDAFVSATMGEGFGGPLTEALREGVPVICPDHTACRDILGPNYQLAIASSPQRHQLWNNIKVYSPSSRWHIADDQSIVEVLKRFSAMSTTNRRDIAHAAYGRVNKTTGAAAVGHVLAEQLRPYVDQANVEPS